MYNERNDVHYFRRRFVREAPGYGKGGLAVYSVHGAFGPVSCQITHQIVSWKAATSHGEWQP